MMGLGRRRGWTGSLIALVLSVSAAAMAQSYSPDLVESSAPKPAPIRPLGAVADDWPDGSACLSQIAIQVDFGSFCSDICVTDADCLEGWGCKGVPQGNAPPIWLCFPRRILPAGR
ncbi:MAG: hypothetical protein IT384_19310 [Deltaproteobacteria bacterium]|nr:hypothetical protein [Deltaproteobacteria bacterium]